MKLEVSLERFERPVLTVVRMAIGWHLAYLGVWALTTVPSFSWVGRFRCARWIFGTFFRGVSESAAMGTIDVVFAWGLLLAGILLLLGKAVKAAGAFGIIYLALMYVLNPPHFGHTGESHFMYIDRNLIEVVMIWVVLSVGRCGKEESK